MFSTLGLFKHLPCPAAASCSLDVCLFAHNSQPETGEINELPPLKKQRLTISSQRREDQGDGKASSLNRFSILQEDDTEANRSASTAAAQENDESVSKPELEPQRRTPNTSITKNNEVKSSKASASSSPLSTPMKIHKTDARAATPSKIPKKELLQPRTMANPPATHPVRFKLLLLVHEQLVRLNKLVLSSKDPSKDKLALTDEDLVKLALDQEQNSAVSNPKVYANVMKNRIGTLKKTDLKDWIEERSTELKKHLDSQEKSQRLKSRIANVRVNTGLSHVQETQVLFQLVASESTLKEHGYMTSVPVEAELVLARAGIDAAKGWEICDRCGCRFRAYSIRQADGAITTGGSCRHHWGRLGPQPRGTGAKPIYSCCRLEQGQPGCEEKPSHVFKVSNPQRLATVLQFEPTPESKPEKHLGPVAFDCEMGYTSYGMELIRLTAAAWPSGDPLLDILVRPKGEVLDLNTRFSGVSIEQWTQAKPWDSLDLPPLKATDSCKGLSLKETTNLTTSQSDETLAIPIVPSTEHARSLFFKLINSSTPLIGHALENDLISVRIIHPTIVDTVILYPHKRGLPLRNKLKFLVRDEIQWTIQEGGSDGHDSLEDALAAGELVRHKIGMKFEVLKRAGWTFEGDELREPSSKT